MKIIEWNVGLNKKYEKIISQICDEEADIYVLTEVKEDFDIKNEQLIERYKVYGADTSQGIGLNNVLILIKVENQEKKEIITQSKDKRDAPDYLIMKVGELSIMGGEV